MTNCSKYFTNFSQTCVSVACVCSSLLPWVQVINRFTSFFMTTKSLFCGSSWSKDVFLLAYVPLPHVCDLTHFFTLYTTMCGTVLQAVQKGGERRGKKGKERPPTQADMRLRSSISSSKPAARFRWMSALKTVWCPFIRSLTSLLLSPSFAWLWALWGCMEHSCHNYRIKLFATVWFPPLASC